MLQKFMFAAATLWMGSAFASSPAFEDLTKAEFKGVVRDFSSVFTHTSVSPASNLGKIFGFEIGVVAGAAQTPEVKKLAQKTDPNSNVPMLPNAGVLGVLSFPLGLSAEALILPESKFSDVTIGNTSLALKWTLSELTGWPFDFAVKVHSAVSKMEFTSVVQMQSVNFDYQNTVSGLALQISKKYAIFEPYLLAGAVQTEGKMKVNSPDIFDTSYTMAQSAKEKITGSHVAVGANFNLVILKLGFEAGRVFESTNAAAKISFYF